MHTQSTDKFITVASSETNKKVEPTLERRGYRRRVQQGPDQERVPNVQLVLLREDRRKSIRLGWNGIGKTTQQRGTAVIPGVQCTPSNRSTTEILSAQPTKSSPDQRRVIHRVRQSFISLMESAENWKKQRAHRNRGRSIERKV